MSSDFAARRSSMRPAAFMVRSSGVNQGAVRVKVTVCVVTGAWRSRILLRVRL